MGKRESVKDDGNACRTGRGCKLLSGKGKAVLFKRFADVDAIDIEIDSRDPDKVVETAAMIGQQADYSCFDSMGEVVEVTTTID